MSIKNFKAISPVDLFNVPAFFSTERRASPLAPDLKTEAPEGKGVGNTLKQRSQTSVKNYEVSRKVETTKAQYGEIKKIKAAVIIREKKIISPEGVETFEKFSDE